MGVDGMGLVKRAETFHAHTQLENLFVVADQWLDLVRLTCDDVADGRDVSASVIPDKHVDIAMAAPPLSKML